MVWSLGLGPGCHENPDFRVFKAKKSEKNNNNNLVQFVLNPISWVGFWDPSLC